MADAASAWKLRMPCLIVAQTQMTGPVSPTPPMDNDTASQMSQQAQVRCHYCGEADAACSELLRQPSAHRQPMQRRRMRPPGCLEDSGSKPQREAPSQNKLWRDV